MLRRRAKNATVPTVIPTGLPSLDLDLDLTSLGAPAAAAPTPVEDTAEDAAPSGGPGRRAPLRAAPVPPAEIETVVTETVGRVLAESLVEIEVEPAALQGLREQSAAAKLLEAVARIDQQTAQIDGMARQLQALTSAVAELSEATRALLRHQWDNMPPQNFWVRVQRADDELRRSLDDLAAEVRGRAPRPGRP